MEDNMNSHLYEMPKIELHCHLDGSMNLEVTKELLAEMGESYTDEQLTDMLQAPEDCPSLADYLTRFDLPIRLIQTKEGLRKSAKAVALDAASENVKYIEVRFAPTFSTNEGLSIREIIESVQKGLMEAEAQSDIKTGIIVCGMRHLDAETNLKMLREAAELYGCGVVACDLAGDEKAFPTKLFVDFFEEAKRLGIPFTIHSGETGSVENIRVAMELGAKRLGHGIAMGCDLDLIRECARNNVGVELCPSSNLQTKAVTSFVEYPLRSFMAAGVPISINTDNRIVSGTTNTREWQRVVEYFAITEQEIAKIYRDSVEMSFATDSIKHELLKKW